VHTISWSLAVIERIAGGLTYIVAPRTLPHFDENLCVTEPLEFSSAVTTALLPQPRSFGQLQVIDGTGRAHYLA